MDIKNVLLIANERLKTPLNSLQELILRETWQSRTYQEIASEYGYDEDYLRTVGSQTWQIFSETFGINITKRTCRRTLERYFGQLQLQHSNFASTYHPSTSHSLYQQHDWEEAVDVTCFLGREPDLDILQHWILNDRCRLVGIFGIGGIGKTALAVKLAQRIQNSFDFLIWRSLRNVPSLQPLLVGIIKRFSRQQETEQSLPTDEGEIISTVIRYLQQRRCLLVLDNIETILQSGNRCGRYRPGYEAYSDFLQLVGEISHQSCLIVTSREKPCEFSTLSGDKLPVRAYPLTGLPALEGQQLLQLKGSFKGNEQSWDALINLYAGNPLALKIAGATIQDLFRGNISRFLVQGISVFDDISVLLAEQFDRLSTLEQAIMYWLAIEREPVEIDTLQQDILRSLSDRELLDSLQSLRRRSLILEAASGFTQQPVVMEYVCDRFNRSICNEITVVCPKLLNEHALIKAKTKDYIRQAQQRVILIEIAQHLQIELGDSYNISMNLQKLIEIAQQHSDVATSYLAGNIIHLKQQLEMSLSGDNFSGLTIRQAQLQNTPFHQAQFSWTTFVDSTFAQKFSNVYSVAFSPNGQYLAASNETGGIIFWERSRYQQYCHLKEHTNFVFSIAFNPDSTILASGGFDHTVKLWDVETGSLIASQSDQNAQIGSVVFSPDGQWLASSDMNGIIQLRYSRTGHALQTLIGSTGQVAQLAFSPDSRWLATGFVDGTAKLFEVKTGRCFQTYQIHPGIIWSIVFHPNGQSFFTGSSDKTIKQTQVRTGKCLQTFTGHNRQLGVIACSADGQTLVTSSHDHSVRCWHIQTGECSNVLEGHGSAIWGLAISPDNQMIASGGMDRTIRLWDFQSGRQLHTLQGNLCGVWSAVFGADDKILISSEEDGTIRTWSTERQANLQSWQAYQGTVACIAAHPYHPYIASSGEDGTVKLWDLQTQHLQQTFHGHQDWIFTLDFSPDGRFLASGCRDWTIKVWDIYRGQCVKTIHKPDEALLWSVKFSADGRTLVSASYDGSIQLWNTQTGQCDLTLRGHTHYMVNSVDVSSNGQFIISGSHDRTVRMWNMTTGDCLRTLEGHTDEVWAVTLSPDDQLIASTGYDATVRLWDVNTGRCLRVFEGHKGWTRVVKFSSDGQRLVTGGYDQTLQLWEINSGQRLAVFQPPQLYEQMDITGVKGLTDSEQDTLLSFGAIRS